MNRKTKIVATIGPASADGKTIRKMIETGMNCARLNFSHGTRAGHLHVIRTIRQAARELRATVAIMQDLSGPKIRIGEIKNNFIQLRKGQTLALTNQNRPGNEQEISISYPCLTRDMKKGNMIMLADGSIQLQVEKILAQSVVCRVLNDGILSSHKGVNFPDSSTSIPAFTAKDRQDLLFGIQHGVDLVACSFIRSAGDLEPVKRLIKKHLARTGIIAKIEKPQAVRDINSILTTADGIMVARGDLGVETPLEKIPLVQKMLIARANEAGKPVITATQMLKSMVDNPSPTRAEVTDVANAILDGTDSVMLSEESAVGKYPVESIAFLNRIAHETEDALQYNSVLAAKESYQEEKVADAISYSVCILARDLNAAAIITPTRSGYTAKMVSRYKPRAPIFAFSPQQKTVNQLTISFGVQAFLLPESTSIDDMLKRIKMSIAKHGLLPKNSLVVISGGPSVAGPNHTNWVRVEII